MFRIKAKLFEILERIPLAFRNAIDLERIGLCGLDLAVIPGLRFYFLDFRKRYRLFVDGHCQLDSCDDPVISSFRSYVRIARKCAVRIRKNPRNHVLNGGFSGTVFACN